MIPGMNDPATAPSVALRVRRRERAGDDPAAPAELLAAAAFISVLTNEPARSAPSLRAAHFWPDRVRLRVRRQAVVLARNLVLAGDALCFGPSAMSRCGRCSTPLDRAGGRPETAAGLPSACAPRLARVPTRRSVRRRGDTRTHWPRASSRATLYRVLNAGVLVKTLVDQGELEAAGERSRRSLRSGDRIDPRCNASPRPRPGCGSNSAGSPKGWMTSWRLASS